MAALPDVYAFDLKVAVAAADLWATRGEQHKKFEDADRNKRFTALDSPERCAAAPTVCCANCTKTTPAKVPRWRTSSPNRSAAKW